MWSQVQKCKLLFGALGCSWRVGKREEGNECLHRCEQETFVLPVIVVLGAKPPLQIVLSVQWIHVHYYRALRAFLALKLYSFSRAKDLLAQFGLIHLSLEKILLFKTLYHIRFSF